MGGYPHQAFDMVFNLIAVKTLGVEDDGGEQPEGHPVAADRGQDDLALRQGGKCSLYN